MVDCQIQIRTQRFLDRMARLEASNARHRELSDVGQSSQSASAMRPSRRGGRSGPIETV